MDIECQRYLSGNKKPEDSWPGKYSKQSGANKVNINVDKHTIGSRSLVI